MIEVEIPKDIRQYEAKLIGPFTLRQTIFFVAGCAFAIPTFNIVYHISTMDVAAFMCMIVATPFLAFGWVKVYGMPLEKFIKTAFISNVLSPKHRKYKTENTFDIFFGDDFKSKQKRVKKNPKTKNKELQSYF